MTRSLVNIERLKTFLERFGRECRGPAIDASAFRAKFEVVVGSLELVETPS